MRHLLAPFLLLSAAACSPLSLGAYAAFRGPGALSAEPSSFQIVSSTPQGVQLDPAGQVLRLSATRSETGQRVEALFALDRLAIGSSGLKGIKPAEGENLFLYKIAPDELERYASLQDQIQGWRDGSKVNTRQVLAMSVLPAGCIVADTPVEGRLSTFWLSVDEGDSFMPLAKDIDPTALALNAQQSEAVHTC